MSDSLLAHIVDGLHRDDRVTAAWLSGSRGRGSNDQYSDIDIWIAIRDDAMEPLLGDPHGFVTGFAPTLMHVPAPEIAPEGGAFIGSWLDWDGGYQQVDWYLTPAGSVMRPPDTMMVKGDVDIQQGEPPARLSPEAARAGAIDNLKLALQMTNNMVKHARRGHLWQALENARHADGCLANAAWLIEHERKPGFGEPRRSWLPPELPGHPGNFAGMAHTFVDAVDYFSREVSADLGPACAALRRRANEAVGG